MNSTSHVTTRQVFAIAGPAMIANLTTPLIGIVSTTAIGRLGDATLLGGVAMASVIFDCLFWLFAFLRMSTVAFTAQSLGAGETRELRAILVRGFIVAAVIGTATTNLARSVMRAKRGLNWARRSRYAASATSAALMTPKSTASRTRYFGMSTAISARTVSRPNAR